MISARQSRRLNSIGTPANWALYLPKSATVALFLLTFSVATQVRAQSPGTFSPTGSMKQARVNFTATLLLNGKVLVAGGGNTQLATKTAELYDPVTRTFAYTGNMTASRREHAATLLPNGKVLITGGINDQDTTLASAELYDPVSGSFGTTGSMIVPRSDHTATLLVSGKVLIAGTEPETELYAPATGKFSSTGPMPNAAVFAAANALSDGDVFIAAGEEEPNSTGEIYDLDGGIFAVSEYDRPA